MAQYRIGGGLSESSIHPAVMGFMLVAILLIFLLDRKYIVIPFLSIMILAPFGQQVYVAGLHVFVGRFVILAAWIRMLKLRRSAKLPMASGGLTVLDKLFLCYTISRAVATYLEFIQMQAIINQVGALIDSLGAFFFLRFVIRSEEDVRRVIKTLAGILLLLSVTMTIEKIAGVNAFGYIGGRLTPFVRDGAIRSQGPFVGPIPAGTFGATLFCLFVWLWRYGKSAFWGITGTVASLIMVVTSASSTPLMAVPAGILGIAMWPLRNRMRAIRWGFLGIVVILHLLMKAPVWMLINHVDLVGGNSSYHRAMIIDGFVRHFSDWWLIGVQSTESWGFDMWDQANEFVSEGEKGGLLTFIFFIALVSRSFGKLGTARRLRSGSPNEWLAWMLGATLFTYVVSFFGISFSDQAANGWYTLLALICAVTTTTAVPSARQQAIRSKPTARPLWPVARNDVYVRF